MENQNEIKNENLTYYQKNKDKLLGRANEQIICECCKKYYARANYKRHLKTPIHKNKFEIQELNNKLNYDFYKENNLI